MFCRLSVGLGVFITEGVKFIISKMACHFHKLHTHATFTDDWKEKKRITIGTLVKLYFLLAFFFWKDILRQWAACGQDKTGIIKLNEWLKIQSLLQHCCIVR